MSDLSALLPSLSVLLDKLGSSPIKLDVSLLDPAVIERLKQENLTLQAAYNHTQEKLYQVERLYAHESALNNRLLDYMNEHGLTVPKSLFRVES